MPLSPQQRRPALALANHAPANGCQNLTEVDARLTKVDKTCHCQPLRHPPAPLRRIPNNPEQIRTTLNKPEHRRTPRPDRTTPRITPESARSKKTEQARPPPSFLRRQEPAPQPSFPRTKHLPKKIHPSPLLGGRLGGGWDVASVHRRSSGRPHSSREHPPNGHSYAGRNPGGPPKPLPRRRPSLAERAATVHGAGSCLRGGVGERRSGCWRAVGACSLPRTPHLASPLKGGRDELGKGGAGCRRAQVPACAGMTEGRCECGLARGSGLPTPHLTSPLKGGRDELGKGVGVGVGCGWVSLGVGCAGSCLRRNDGWGGWFLPAQE